MEKRKPWVPFLALLFCFIVVIFSIYAIINLSKPNNLDIAKQREFINKITNLIQSPSNLSYKTLDNDFINKSDDSTSMSAFNFNPEIKKLPPIQQDVIIREKLVALQAQTAIDMLTKQEASYKPLIFKIWFWFFGLLAWAASISGGLILKFWTNKYVIDRYWNNPGR